MTNLQIIKDYQHALWDVKDITAIDRTFSEDALIHSAIGQDTARGTDKMKFFIGQWHVGFPNSKVYWEDYICDADKVVCRWRAEGKHQGEFLGHAPSNKTINYSGVTIYKLNNGKVDEYWAYMDMSGILKQLAEA